MIYTNLLLGLLSVLSGLGAVKLLQSSDYSWGVSMGSVLAQITLGFLVFMSACAKLGWIMKKKPLVKEIYTPSVIALYCYICAFLIFGPYD